MNDRPNVSPIPTAAAAAAQSGKEVVETVTTTETVVKTPGFFGRMARAMQRRPIATSVGLSVGTGVVAAGAYNYRRTGSVMPSMFSPNDAVDVANAVARICG